MLKISRLKAGILQGRFLIAFISLMLLLIFVGLLAQEPQHNLVINGSRLSYETAQTDAAHQKGLSNRKSLSVNHAMLFVFNQSDMYCFWMKDMHFPLDIIWLNDAKQVVFIKQNVAPNTYPHSFCPNAPAHYVVEVNQGIVHTDGLKVGDPISF